MTERQVVGAVLFGGGEPCVGARVKAVLSGASVFYDSSGSRVGATATLTDGVGAFSLQLEPNAGLSPSGSRWLVTATAPGGEVLWAEYILVVAGSGEAQFDDLLDEAPGALVAPQTTVAIAAAVAAARTYVDVVKDFGAVGDGVADDTAAVSDALDDGRDVYFPPGTYLVDPIVCTVGGRSVRGSGPLSIVKKADQSDAAAITFYQVSDVTVRDLAIDGSADSEPATTGRYGIRFSKSANCAAERLTVYAAQTDGIVFDLCTGCRVVGNISRNNKRKGIYLSGCDSCVVSNNVLYGNYYGMSIMCTWHSAVSGNACYANTGDEAHAGRDTRFCSFTGNTFGGWESANDHYGFAGVGEVVGASTLHGVAYDGSTAYGMNDCLLSCNVFYGPIVLNRSHRNTIVANSVLRSHIYGIGLVGATDNIVMTNHVAGWAAANYPISLYQYLSLGQSEGNRFLGNVLVDSNSTGLTSIHQYGIGSNAEATWA